MSYHPHRALLAALVCALPVAPLAAAEDHTDLLGLMTSLQTLLHKAQLAVDAGNGPLAAFYVHELEETAEAVTEVDEYDGHPIGTLTAAMLVPAIDALDEALQRGDLPAGQAGDGIDRVMASCNACHAATGHGFIVIERNAANPFAQRFAPR